MKKYLGFLLKLGVAIGIFWYLSKTGVMSFQTLKEALLDVKNNLMALSLIIIATLMGALRWHLLLNDQGFKLTYLQVLNLSYIGNFFNSILPGGVTGDLVKGVYLNKTKSDMHASFATIFLDRFLGLTSLVILASFVLNFLAPELENFELFHIIEIPLNSFALFFILFFSYLFLVSNKYDPLKYLLQKLQNQFPYFSIFVNFYDKLKEYKDKKMVLATGLILSIALQAIYCSSYIFVCRAFQENQVFYPGIFVITPIALLICAIPIAPAGLGTGNVAYYYLAQAIGTQKGADIFSLATFLGVSLSFVGGLLYIRVLFMNTKNKK